MGCLRNYLVTTVSIVTLVVWCCNAQLSPNFYDSSCPRLQSIVRNGMSEAIAQELRIAASILRLFFHDCFVNGCDASLLLDDTETFTGEKNARPNKNSVRGYEIIDDIKARVEAACPDTVSCSDILALATREGVALIGGPTWTVPLGRRDSRTACLSAVVSAIPSPSCNLTTLIYMFAAKGLSARDMVALSGAHTVGFAQCVNFRKHVHNESNINPGFAADRRSICPASKGEGEGDSNTAALDIGSTNRFDNNYYRNLVTWQGLLHSDQELFNNGSQDWLVRLYSENAAAFMNDFSAAMVKMGNISPLTGTDGEIRRNCRVIN